MAELTNAATFERTTGPLGGTEVSEVDHIEGDFVVMTDDSPAYKVSIDGIKENQNKTLKDSEGNVIA